ncbi:MAG TPA: hypothetical protein PKI05_13635, partial [Thermogutta sp.]|nr:hypothetical protein [Thermogutta sp.]
KQFWSELVIFWQTLKPLRKLLAVRKIVRLLRPFGRALGSSSYLRGSRPNGRPERRALRELSANQ